ncbi:hypothetical protein TSUD_234930 [Trifolium subterraneum]|uniref:Uncharacterized protein n=1 Tax=Trifolium subterraneum TaxID=3900 RepID=A0A2Z6LTN3_TRISU|nr:hypothetical protein TSUD_234930 [Trifolium subterraneum]
MESSLVVGHMSCVSLFLAVEGRYQRPMDVPHYLHTPNLPAINVKTTLNVSFMTFNFHIIINHLIQQLNSTPHHD